PEQVRSMFHGDDEIINAAEDFIAKRDLSAEASNSLQHTLTERTDQLQSALNEIAKEQELPALRISADRDALGPFTHAAYEPGQMVVREDWLLRGGDPVELIKNAYHEWEHNEQVALMIRGSIDDVIDDIRRSTGVEVTITADDYSRLQQLRKE